MIQNTENGKEWRDKGEDKTACGSDSLSSSSAILVGGSFLGSQVIGNTMGVLCLVIEGMQRMEWRPLDALALLVRGGGLERGNPILILALLVVSSIASVHN